MGKVKAVLVAVSEYKIKECPSLPLCKNDLYAMRKALIDGINVEPENILLCGETGIVSINDLAKTIYVSMSDMTKEDTYIFYFSGHGGNKCLFLTKEAILLQELLDIIETVPVKNKIAIIDSCHSGDFQLDKTPEITIQETVNEFAGHGFAVMTSCGVEEVSGFHPDKRISLYTSFVCDALMSRSLIRKGKKSLEYINEAVFHLAETHNQKEIKKEKRGRRIQNPIFRTSIGGTIFFDVEEYNPYKVQQIYEETEDYIIYIVEPLHTNLAKRFTVRVILRYQCTMEQVASIAKEIKEKLLFCEVYQNKEFEEFYSMSPTNIIFYYFGYDEDDIINSNFIYHATWVDDSQDKNHWYKNKQGSAVIEGIYVETQNQYELIKEIQKNDMDEEDYIKVTREYTIRMISIGEKYIQIFREYLNKVITEEELMSKVKPFNKEISEIFFMNSDLPVAPTSLHDWASAHDNIISAIHDFSLFYNEKHLSTWESEKRKWLMKNAIKQYESDLENLKGADCLLNTID